MSDLPRSQGADRKHELAQKIALHIRSRRLTRAAAAGMLEIEQAMVIKIMRGQCNGLTEAWLTAVSERLFEQNDR